MSVEPSAIVGALSRFLRDDERTEANHAPTLPWVIEAQRDHRDYRSCVELLTRERQKIRDGIIRWGAVLLRGFDIADAESFTGILESLGLALDTNFDLEPSQRKLLSTRSFESVNEFPEYLLEPHTEMAYSWWRPNYISFYCALAPAEAGETPIFDFQAVLRSMDASVRRRFETVPMLFKRHFTQDYLKNKYGGDITRLEAALVRGGYTFKRLDGDYCMAAECLIPSVIRHPVTMEPVFNFPWFWDRVICTPWYFETWKMFPARGGWGGGQVGEHQDDPHEARMSFVEGEQLSAAEIEELCRLTYRNATHFRWITGDVVIIDNARIGHTKCPHRGPRKLHAALANMFSIKDQLLKA